MDLRQRQRLNTHATNIRRAARPQSMPAQHDGQGVTFGGNPLRAQKVSNGAMGNGDAIVLSGDSGLVQQELRRVRRGESVGRASETVGDCVLPGVMVYQNITTFYRPNSAYASFDSLIYYKEKIIWFSNNGAPVELYESKHFGGPQIGYIPDTQFYPYTSFWSNSDGTGQCCFLYRKQPVGPEFYDIWDLSDSGASLRSTTQVVPDAIYKGGSLGIGPGVANPYYILRETPRTVVSRTNANTWSVDIEGTQYPVKERIASGAIVDSSLPYFPNSYSVQLPTMAKDFVVRYGLRFATTNSGNTDKFCWTINGNISALNEEQVYSRQNDNTYQAKSFDPANPSVSKPQNLKVASFDLFPQDISLPTPPFAANEHYWIESKVPATAIDTQEGLGCFIRLIGSYFNASSNCLVKNGTTLAKTPIGRPWAKPYDPNVPI